MMFKGTYRGERPRDKHKEYIVEDKREVKNCDNL